MNRLDDSEPRVRAWLHDEAHGELPDWVLRKTFDITRATRQRQGLRGWLASRRGRGGTDTRRRSNLFTIATVSAAAAAAILATGALIDTSPPVMPGAEVPGITVEEQMFSGSFSYGPGCPDEVSNGSDYCWEQSGVNFDDPRFQGRVYMWANSDYADQGIYRNRFIIETDEGRWVGEPVPGILASEGDGLPSVHLLQGEGAYEGLHAVLGVDLEFGSFLVEGYVVDGGFPELPQT